MRVQDFIAERTQWAADCLYKNVRRVPEDKLLWQVEGVGRTVLDQVQECAQSSIWTISLLAKGKPVAADPEAYQRLKEERQAWTTIDLCEQAHRAKLTELLTFIREVPDEDLDRRISIPFSDEPVSIAEILNFHNWNLTYHLGQIMFIQTLYGDQEMVF